MERLQEHFNLIETFLPKYLSLEQRTELFKDIEKHFPHSQDPAKVYWKSANPNALFQGDGIRELPLTVWNTQDDKHDTVYFPGVILSNTCDINPQNKRLNEPLVVVAGVYPVAEYVEALASNGIEEDRVISFLDSLRKNKITNLFYLPEIKRNDDMIMKESFVRFDFVASIPAHILHKYDHKYYGEGDRLFSLSNYGFYVFVFKLSVHSCRFREAVFRSK